MSGRAKHGTGTADSHEELRKLTRELHEAAADARAAIRELRAARAAIALDLGSVIQAETERLNEHFKKGLDVIGDLVNATQEIVAKRMTDQFGLDEKLTHEEWLNYMARNMALRLGMATITGAGDPPVAFINAKTRTQVVDGDRPGLLLTRRGPAGIKL